MNSLIICMNVDMVLSLIYSEIFPYESFSSTSTRYLNQVNSRKKRQWVYFPGPSHFLHSAFNSSKIWIVLLFSIGHAAQFSLDRSIFINSECLLHFFKPLESFWVCLRSCGFKMNNLAPWFHRQLKSYRLVPLQQMQWLQPSWNLRYFFSLFVSFKIFVSLCSLFLNDMKLLFSQPSIIWPAFLNNINKVWRSLWFC